MGVEVGQVNINLRLSLAKFSQDVQDGGNAAKEGAADISSAFSGSSKEATASLALIGEEIGINIPRHIRTFIAQIPGVGSALSLAFSSVAVLALAEVIVKIVEKIQDYRNHLAESADAWTKTNQLGTDAIKSLDTQLLELQVRLDELTGNHVAALQDKLKLIDGQTLQHISDQFKSLGQSVDEAFKKMEVGWLASLAGLGNDTAVKQASAEMKELFQTIQDFVNDGKGSTAIADAINSQIISVMNRLGALKNEAGYFKDENGPAEYAAGEKELEQLNRMYTAVQKNIEAGSDKKTLDTITAENAETERKIALEKQKLKILEEVSNLPTNGRTLSKTGTPLGAGEFVDASALANSPNLGATKPTDLYGGAKEAKDQLDLTTDLNDQILRGQELYTSTRNEAEKYANEMQTLNTLLASGAISQDTYNRAVTQAKAKYDDVSRGLQQIGDTVGRDIAQAALYGGSWTKAFQDIAAEIVKVVIQLTILKSLQQASAASGGGGFLGFLTSLTGGLAGKADGGFVGQGTSYLVGERGPEIYTPSTSGTIIPNGALRGSGGPQVVTSSPVFHFHGVQDADSFRKSQGQIASEMMAMLSRAAQRNG